jgi:tripartite-type tricarboxylate transporter receptor subunit TctC
MALSRRSLLALGAALPLPAIAQVNTTPIRILHGSSAGAPQDIMLRILAEELGHLLSRRVLVEARPGANGQIAMNMLKQAPADGTVIFSDGTGITSILQLPHAQHHWRDFEPLARLQLDPFALYVRTGGDFPGFAVFVEAMRRKGEDIRIGGFATGSPHQITTMQLASRLGAKFTWVPYDSGTTAITAVMGRHIEASMSNISVYPSFRDRMTILAHTGESRIEPFGHIPTFREQAVDLARYHWRGMFMRREVPKAQVDQMKAWVDEAVRTPRFQAYLRDTGTLDGTMDRAAFAAMLEEQAAEDTRILRELHLLP